MGAIAKIANTETNKSKRSRESRNLAHPKFLIKP